VYRYCVFAVHNTIYVHTRMCVCLGIEYAVTRTRQFNFFIVFCKFNFLILVFFLIHRLFYIDKSIFFYARQYYVLVRRKPYYDVSACTHKIRHTLLSVTICWIYRVRVTFTGKRNRTRVMTGFWLPTVLRNGVYWIAKKYFHIRNETLRDFKTNFGGRKRRRRNRNCYINRHGRY